MGFQLVIAEGKEAGREFVFDQTSILIGRTSECDVILYEPGVSRKHARIFNEGASFFVEDMGSSNGTKVNGNLVKKQALKDGDAIGLGPVVFNFAAIALEAEGSTDEVPLGEGGGQHTRVVSAAELKKSRNKGVAGLERGVDHAGREQKERASTQMIAAIKPRTSNPGAAKAAPPERKSNPALARQERGRAAVARDDDDASTGRALRPRGRVQEDFGPLSAAERARIRREAGNPGLAALRIWWAEASEKKRKAVLIASAVAGVLIAGLCVYAVLPREAGRKVAEPGVLSAESVKYSFGLGEDVTFDRPDEKSFEFEVATPVAAVVLVHTQSLHISQQEVSVNVNGEEIGWLPPDTMNSTERSHEFLVPASVVKRNGVNVVVFDNVKNPPGEDSWRIWNLWIEVMVLPDKDEQGLIADANEKYKKGQQKWEQRDIGAANRWEAYRGFREAWLTYLAVPESSRPPTWMLARDKMRELRGELDLQCNKLLLEARSKNNQKQYDQARSTLDHVKDFFPSSTGHPCQYRSEVEREDLEL